VTAVADRRTLRSAPLRVGGLSWRVPVRAGVVALAGTGVLLVLVAVDLATGDFAIPLPGVVRALAGGGDAGQRFVVQEVRLPQAAVALMVGAALGLAGALTQTFARNPLASPDILGVTQGAAAGAVGFIVLGSTSAGAGLAGGVLGRVGLPGAAFLGGSLAAASLYVLSWRRGIDGQRLVLVGIGISAALAALTSWLLVGARLPDAASAQVWLNGSLSSRGWEQGLPLLRTLVVLVPVALVLVRHLNAMQLGDESAVGLGVRLQLTQLLVLLTSVGLASVAVAAVGPLEFVALVVPQVALRLTGGSRPPLLASMVLGACLVVSADLLTRGVLPWTVPVGLVTAVVGAPYLILLLLRTNRKVT
jgi:iron complex transport system permease protein